MQQVIVTENLPIKLWLDEIEDGALQQCKNIANLPFLYKHFAVMPDSHEGYGMPIGGVMATDGVIIPNAVGVDIGCGMCAINTGLEEISREDLLKIVEKIKQIVPLGFEHHKLPQSKELMPQGYDLDALHIVKSQYQSALHQIGTLGGGNHFIEIQKGSDGNIWIMIHSGSRNIGLKVAEHYNKIAVFQNELYYSGVDKKVQLAFLPIKTKEARDYMNEMKFCVDFALANRTLMMNNIIKCFEETVGILNTHEMINIAHNYARWENHFGKNVIVHRKGATSAKEGEIGIIPGSMGSKSYIIEGLGNPESFMSCSHGAGRKMGRRQAIKTLSMDEEVSTLNSQGIIHDLDSIEKLDEATGSYKDIDVVMDNQKDLVKILVELKPLAVIKG